MRRNGLRPGEIGWEAEGVCEAVTEPRLKNVASSDATPASSPRRGGGTLVWGGFALFDQSFQSKSVSFSDRLHSLSMTGFSQAKDSSVPFPTGPTHSFLPVGP